MNTLPLNERPSSKNLLKSTLLTAAAALVVIVTIVFPAEYGVDVTGAGRVLGLTEMGEIKRQLAIEAEKDRVKVPEVQKKSSFMRFLASLNPISTVYAQTAVKEDKLTFTLKPSESIEYKLVMKKGAKATYSWVSSESGINYDVHGEINEQTPAHSYKKGRGVAKDEGEITAAFDGTHGWFWRNRGTKPATIEVNVKGDYSAIKKI